MFGQNGDSNPLRFSLSPYSAKIILNDEVETVCLYYVSVYHSDGFIPIKAGRNVDAT